jgi:hypothetical protein
METTDPSRRVATSSDSEFTLTVDDALLLYAEAGIPRTPRSVQRYCGNEHLSARRVETEFGEKFLITRARRVKFFRKRVLAAMQGYPRLELRLRKTTGNPQ